MLPQGFHFERFIDGPGLYLGSTIVASAGPANYDRDSPWRLCLNPTGLPRYVFTPTEVGATRYMESWAAKWEVEIRDAVGRSSNGLAHLRQRDNMVLDTRHPRRRSRRIPRIAR